VFTLRCRRNCFPNSVTPCHCISSPTVVEYIHFSERFALCCRINSARSAELRSALRFIPLSCYYVIYGIYFPHQLKRARYERQFDPMRSIAGSSGFPSRTVVWGLSQQVLATGTSTPFRSPFSPSQIKSTLQWHACVGIELKLRVA